MPPNPPSNAHGFAMRSMSLRHAQHVASRHANSQILKKNSWPPPSQILGTPLTTSCDEKTENIDTDCDVLSPALFSVTNPPTLTRVPRKPRVLKQELRRNISQANLDSFVVRDSSLKRKPSGDVIVSPSSSHVDKTTKADDEDDVS